MPSHSGFRPVLVAFFLIWTAVPAKSADVRIEQHLDAARKAESVQNYAAASNEYREILKLQPNLALVRQSLAITYHLQNRYLEAIAEFQRAVRQDPALWGAYLFLGMDYYKSNQFAEAIPPLEKSIALNAKMAEPEARFWLAATYSALDRPDDAVRELRRDLELRPKDIDVLYSLTQAYNRSAGAAFERLGRIDPNSAAVAILQAERLLDENKTDLAKLEYRKAIQLRPDFAGWIPALANEPPVSEAAIPEKTIPDLLRHGRFPEAQELLSKAVETDSNPSLRLDLIRCDSEIGNYAAAEEQLRKFLAKDPDNVDALHLLGRNYKYLAAASLQQMIAADPDSYGVHELLGQRHEEHTEFDLAIQEYKAALAKKPDAGGVRYAIGNIYRKTSQYDQAEQWFTEELKHNPYHGLAQYRLGSVYLETGKPEEAIRHLESALRAHPRLIDARLELGRAYTAAGRYNEAVIALKEVAAAQPDNDRVHYLLSSAYSKQGKKEEARAELETYQRLTRKRLQQTQQDIRSLSDSLQK